MGPEFVALRLKAGRRMSPRENEEEEEIGTRITFKARQPFRQKCIFGFCLEKTIGRLSFICIRRRKTSVSVSGPERPSQGASFEPENEKRQAGMNDFEDRAGNGRALIR